MRVLVIGASGMLGKVIFDYFSKFSQYTVYGLCRNKLEIHNDLEQNFFYIDICNEKKFSECLKIIKPEIIINCAAIVNVDMCETDLQYALMLNSEAITVIARYCHDAKFIYISTDSVFDGKKGDYTEADVVNPLNNYSISKYYGELNTIEGFKKYLIIRTNIYGFHENNGSSLVEWALKELKNGNKIFGFEDVYFNPVYTRQLAIVIKKLIEVDFLGIINVASQRYISKYSFLTKLAKFFQLDANLIEKQSIDSIKFKAVRAKNTTLSTNKLEILLNYVPDFEEGLNELHNDFKNICKIK
jgi:dTDP-4-dehydrorhamnose reductase